MFNFGMEFINIHIVNTSAYINLHTFDDAFPEVIDMPGVFSLPPRVKLSIFPLTSKGICNCYLINRGEKWDHSGFESIVL